jgi:hypothetical protein
MPITLNNSNISVQYNTGSNYIIETVKSDLYRNNDMVDTIIRDNIQTAPVTPTTFVDNSGNVYAVESYTYSGSANTKDYTRVFPKNTTCDILIVGGGGGGGQQNAGGGGAGGLVLVQNLQANGSFTINVGKGGNGGISQSRGSVGNNSTFIKSDNSVIITANGGGGGGSTGISGQGDGLLATNGGSGGGGGYYLANGTQTQKSQSQIGVSSPAILNQFGEDGGHGGGSTSSYPGGGGGGAGGVGATSTSDTIGQNGGQGIDRVGTFVFSQAFLSSIGDNGWFAGGGGSGGAGASDGYGNGGSSLFGGGGNGDGIGRGINGINGTGGGGGSVREPGSTLGGNGGSGIVIIRYLLGTVNYLISEPTINPSIIATNVYYPKVPATNSATWTDSGYTVNVKVSDTVGGASYVYYLFNHIITTNPATGGDDYYHSQQIYTGAGNTYNGVTRFKTFAGIAIGVDYGRSIYPKRMRIAPHQSSSVNNAFPKAFKIFASDDASCWNDNNHSSWAQIHDQTTTLTITNGQYTIVNFAENLPKYRYYTMVVLSVIGIYSTGGYLVFAEWNIGGDEKIDAIPEGNPVTHKTLNFTYVPPPLIYDFTNYNTRATWLAYAATIPTFTTSELDYMFDPFDPDSVFLSNTRVGWVQMTLPSTHNFFTITYGLGTQAVEPVRLLVNGVIKSTYGTINSVTTYSQAYNVGDVVRIEEGLSTMSGNFIFQFTNTNSTTNTYALSVQPGTSVQVNNGTAQYLSGNYTITVGATQSSVLGLSGQTNPYPLTNGSSIAIKYYLLGINNYLTSEPTVILPTFTESIRTFIHSGGAEAQTSYNITVGQNTICDILIVGGGGAGGTRHGGGGGAGAVIYLTNQTFFSGTYTIRVGKGGTAKTDNMGQGNKGDDSSVSFNLTNIYLAKGGGAGHHDVSTGNSNKDGGSGAGSGGTTPGNPVSTNIPSGIYGNSGGILTSYNGGGGGGGGALTSGTNGTATVGGNGGAGISISITGTAVTYGGGGGGGSLGGYTPGTGGVGGGGNGSQSTSTASSGSAGTGGGGGGGGFWDSSNGPGGNGGSGIVIIKFKSTIPILEGITHKRLNFTYNNDNLVAWYRFNGDYLDSSGNGNNLTNVGSVIQSTHIIEGQAVEFDSTDYLEFPATINPYTIWNGKGITFSCWIRFTAHETWARLIDFQSAVNQNTGFYISIKSNWNGTPGAILVNIAEGTLFTYSNWSNSIITTLGAWHHFVWCIDVTGKWDVYLNNVRINNTETRVIPNITYNLRYINKSAYSVDGTWDGQIDDFRIYDRALSATDVSLLYNKTYPMPNLYTLNFPVPTVADINNNSNIVLRGAYDISLSTTSSLIIPKAGQYIPRPTTFTTSNMSIRYNILGPTRDPIGAQWTYNSSNTSVYHMGSVGIGTTNPEYQLDVRGNIYSSTGGFTQSGLTTWTVLSDSRIKENIVKASYDKCLENVKNIELYNFNFKENYVSTNDRHQLGFIAQEVQAVYPKAVEVGKMSINAGNAGDTNDIIENILTLNTTQIDYTLYGAVKNLIEKVENLEDELQYIENDL